MLIWLALTAMAIMRLWPEIPIARWLHLVLVEAPLRLAAGLERRHLVFLILLLVVLAAGGEMLALAGPNIGVAIIWDVATYVDLAAAMMAAGALARTRPKYFLLRARISSLVRRIAGHRRQRRARRLSKPPAGRDSDGWAARPAFA